MHLLYFLIVRFYAQIRLTVDSSFGRNGISTLSLGNAVAVPSAVLQVLQANDGSSDFYLLIRLNGLRISKRHPNGNVDSSFGLNGFSQASPISGNSYAVLQTNGKIVVGGAMIPNGAGTTQYFITRYNTNGSIDESFGSGGYHFSSATGSGPGMLAISNQGQVVSGLISNNQLFISLLNANGSSETGFQENETFITFPDLQNKQLSSWNFWLTNFIHQVPVEIILGRIQQRLQDLI